MRGFAPRRKRVAYDRRMLSSPAADPAFWLAASAVGLAGLVRGFAGFGSAMIMIPALGAIHGPAPAVAIGLGLEILLSLPFVGAVARQVDWSRMALLSATGLAAVPLGVRALLAVPAETMRLAMSGVVLAFVAVLAFGWRHAGRPTVPATAAAGAASGFLNGAVGMAGPPVVFFLLSGPYAAAEVRASCVVYFAIVDLAALGVLGVSGALDRAMAVQALWLAPVYLLAAWAGAKGFGRANEAAYRKVALGILVAVALGSLLG